MCTIKIFSVCASLQGSAFYAVYTIIIYLRRVHGASRHSCILLTSGKKKRASVLKMLFVMCCCLHISIAHDFAVVNTYSLFLHFQKTLYACIKKDLILYAKRGIIPLNFNYLYTEWKRGMANV